MQKILDYCLSQGISAKTGEILANHNTFKIGGKAEVFIQPKTKDELCNATAICKSADVKIFYLGKGSNILFSDEGFNGAVIDICAMQAPCELNGNVITANAGVSLASLCIFAQKNALSGLEFAYGIPGSVGGAVYMNAGAYGGEMSDTLKTVEVLTANGDIITRTASEMNFGYRKSAVQKNGDCILSATFELKNADKEQIKAKMDEHMKQRKDKQPIEMPSAGSTFKRPEGAFAGALIDECGFRGFKMGNAAVSEKHCGFVVNLGGATCKDVLELCEHIQKIVKEKTGYTLEREVRVIN